ncbi:MAG: hypothetical protein OXJ52_01180 [Oligoflexia bacterium]|nr:hypothetical protein [Oligoflexia bacterium]
MKACLKIGHLFLWVGLLNNCVFQPGSSIYVGDKDLCGFAVSQYSGQGLRWDESKFPIPFYMHHSVPKNAKDNFISAVSHWNLRWTEYLQEEGVKPFPLFAVVDKHNLYNGKPGKDENNFLFFVDNKFSRYESNPNTQAITTIASMGHEIRDTDILVNDEAFDYYYDPSYNQEITLAENKIKESRRIASSRSPGLRFKIAEQFKQWLKFLLKPFTKQKAVRHIATPFPKIPRNKVDFPSLIIHELGHVPGLAHFSHDSLDYDQGYHRSKARRSSKINSYHSVMEPRLSSGRARRKVTDHDLDNLICGYLGVSRP